MDNVKRVTKANLDAFKISSSVKLLGNLNWPKAAETTFLNSYNKGRATLPEIVYKTVDYSDQKAALSKLANTLSTQEPMEKYTRETIHSFIDAIDLNHSIGTKTFTELSIKIFGEPGQRLPGSDKNIIESAEKVVQLSSDFTPPFIKDPEPSIEATSLKTYMDRKIEGAFKGHGPKVTLVKNLPAKATASANTIKLRSGPHFTQYDFKQLFYHEVMTHALTSLNGREQKVLKCMGRSSLRALKTQEGLATFSEIITGSMDIKRLTRLALRILAIDAALKGATFVEVFEFFLERGQCQRESYLSTYRIFRGGFPDKNIVFTKDCIYLEGLINVHTLFRWAMKHNKLEICHLLFCGRLNLDDLFTLEEAYHYQWISPPKYLPSWFSKVEGLAGTLSFSLLANLVRIDIADENFYRKV